MMLQLLGGSVFWVSTGIYSAEGCDIPLSFPPVLDIIVYAPQHFRNNHHPLLRLGYNIPLNNGTEVILEEGHYQLKVS